MSNEAKCPFSDGARKQAAAGATTNANWWPNQLNVKILNQHSPLSNPMDKSFDYAKEFNSLDLHAVVRELGGGGWMRPGLTEILCDHTGIGEMSLLLRGLHAGREPGAAMQVFNGRGSGRQ